MGTQSLTTLVKQLTTTKFNFQSTIKYSVQRDDAIVPSFSAKVSCKNIR